MGMMADRAKKRMVTVASSDAVEIELLCANGDYFGEAKAKEMVRRWEDFNKAYGNIIRIKDAEADSDFYKEGSLFVPEAEIDSWLEKLVEEGIVADIVHSSDGDRMIAKSMKAVASSDAEYLAAAEAGDIEKCQAMVDAAAKAAGYTVGPVYHGTRKEFVAFDPRFSVSMGFHFGTESQAMDRGDLIKKFFLKGEFLEVPDLGFSDPDLIIERLYDGGILSEDQKESLFREVGDWKDIVVAFRKIARFLNKEFSVDGLVYSNLFEGGGTNDYSYAVFSPSQIKSADPITYDDSGNIIPLSKRFNSASNDIRAAKIKAEGRRYKSGLEDYVLHSDIVGDITVEKMARKIEQKKLNSDKDELFNSVMGSVNQTLLNHMILTLPSGAYLLHTKGRAAPLIGDVIMEKYGVWAGTCVDEKVLRGLAALFPERISVSFTHGLEEISIKDSENRKMNLQEKYKALKASGKIPATGRTEEILAEDDWVRVRQMAVPEIGAEKYTFTEAKRDTVAAFIEVAASDGVMHYLMRNEAALYSNFVPCPKLMTETIEEGESPDEAVMRGLKEEFGIDDADDFRVVYLGSIPGTFQELHQYHIYYVKIVGDYNREESDMEATGDGSRGEDHSNTVMVRCDDFAQTRDFLSWIAYGMLEHAKWRMDPAITDMFGGE